MPRALKNLDISLGLVTIPVQLFIATSSQGIAFHPLHARCGSRIQMRLECPIHGIVPREETVKGYEIAKDEYVRFEPEELNALRGVRRSGGVDERARGGRHRAAQALATRLGFDGHSR
jgi:DNA end-binding protein Ku